MAKEKIYELSRLSGVGKVLAQRLREEGLDSCDKILVAGEKGLQRIKGLSAKQIPKILEEASIIADDARRSRDASSALVEEGIVQLKRDIHDFVKKTESRYRNQLEKGKGQVFQREASRLISTLEHVEQYFSDLMLKLNCNLNEVGETLSRLDDEKLKNIAEELKKTRKDLKKIIY
jgi:hypothetical protein